MWFFTTDFLWGSIVSLPGVFDFELLKLRALGVLLLEWVLRVWWSVVVKASRVFLLLLSQFLRFSVEYSSFRGVESTYLLPKLRL